mgnify:FL=1
MTTDLITEAEAALAAANAHLEELRAALGPAAEAVNVAEGALRSARVKADAGLPTVRVRHLRYLRRGWPQDRRDQTEEIKPWVIEHYTPRSMGLRQGGTTATVRFVPRREGSGGGWHPWAVALRERLWVAPEDAP